MLMTLIVGTRNRAAQLKTCLAALAGATKPAYKMELILVDNGSTDSTEAVIRDFVSSSPIDVRYVYCEKPGISAAHNAGIAAATGKWLLFTDDDCYVDKDYFVNFHKFIKSIPTLGTASSPISYGGGQIHFFDSGDDTRIASRYFDEFWEIPKSSLLAASAIQGANMFFRKKVFDTIGGFNERMGAGAPFSGADIELACRASIAGFVGAQVPSLKVFHHHRRASGSPKADAAVESYDHGRGAYYAGLLDMGLVGAWQLWASACGLENNGDPELRKRLVREFEGAALYLKTLIAEREASGLA